MTRNHGDGASGRAGFADVARLAGVGIATVDRVLNERGNVAPATARRVIEAARQLELRRVLPKPYVRQLRFEVLLARPDTPFLARLSQGFAAAATVLGKLAIVQRTVLRNAGPERVAEQMAAAKADGLILYGEEHPAVVDAIATVTAAGKPVVCMVTDVPGSSRIAYVGIDNAKAGRTAGFLAGRMAARPGSALVVTNDLGFCGHAERVAGFRDGLARAAPGLPIAAVLQGHDEDDRAARLVTTALRTYPDVVAVYNSGGAVAAIGSAIAKHDPEHRIVYIGHELNPTTATLLQEGVMTVTIDQAFELQARRAVEVLLHRFGQLDAFPGPAEVPFTLHTRENM